MFFDGLRCVLMLFGVFWMVFDGLMMVMLTMVMMVIVALILAVILVMMDEQQLYGSMIFNHVPCYEK